MVSTMTRKRVHAAAANQSSHAGTNDFPSRIEAENTIRILIASDNHIGYAERDAVRGDDSYNSFREVMEIAKSEDVDMVLLAGDLFHENKPSRKAMYQAIRSLRLNCLGDKPCELEVLGDQSVATEDAEVMHINYENQDINVAIPVFSIHGNHDDPSGEGRLCALDILQVSGLLNYFGRVPENDDITVKPVLLQKGTTKLALYGLSNVRDERLHRSFRHNKVKFMRPELYQDEWFNLIAVHQNHFGHSETNYLPENFIQNFFDFVVWGHEHECVIDPVLNPEQDFHVCQPGSSVATSLCAGEAVAKRIGVLSIRDREFKMKTIPLKSVRPFIFKELTLSDVKTLDPKKKNKSDVIAYLMEQVEEAILEAQEQWLDLHPEQDDQEAAVEPPLPLIRLRVDYSSATGTFELENPQRFSQRFLGRVANANDVVQFHMRKKAAARKAKGDAATLEKPDLSDVGLTGLKVSALVKQFLAKQSLQCLPENELGDAVAQFVEKDDKDAVKDFVADHLKAQVSMMTSNKTTTERTINEAMTRSKNTLSEQFAARKEQIEQRRRQKESMQVSDMESDGEPTPAPTAPASKRATAASKGAAAKTTKTTKRKTSPATTRKSATRRKKPVSSEEEEEDEEEEEEAEASSPDQIASASDDDDAPPPPKARGRAAAKPRAAAARKPSARQTQLAFEQTQTTAAAAPAVTGRQKRSTQAIELSSDDESDGFQPVAKKRRS